MKSALALCTGLALCAVVQASVTVDAAKHAVTFTATSTDCGMDTALEFLFVGPGSDHGYESLFVTDDDAAEIAKAFERAGIPTGKGIDPAACRFWPTGGEISIEPSFTNLVREMRKEALPGIIYTGGKREPNGVPVAATNMPLAVFALYNCPQALIQFDDSLEQSTTYGRFQPAVKIKKGERRSFTITWKGTPGALPFTARFESGAEKLKATVLTMQQAAAQRSLDVTTDFTGDLTLAEAIASARTLEALDSAKVRINGFVPGQFYYRSFLPLVKWRERSERLSQPLEIQLGENVRCIYIKEDWSGNTDEPKLIPQEIPLEKVSGVKNIDTVFFYADKSTKLEKFYALRDKMPKSVRNWYLFENP